MVDGQIQAVLIGRLSKMVSTKNGISRAQMNVSYVLNSESGDYRKTTGEIVLSLKGRWPAGILPGHSIAVRAMVQPTGVINVPGTFNYRKHLSRKNIYVTGLVQSPLLIQKVKTLKSSYPQKMFYTIERTRLFISESIEESLPERAGTLYRALIIGDRSTIEPDIYETLKRAGILHILAISGMHLGLLATITYFCFYWLLRRSEKLILHINTRKYALFLTLPLLLVYALLAGFQTPVVRALIMTGCLVIGYGVNRLQSPLTTLSLSALLILIFDPFAIESPSFQLSFAAVTAILLLTPRLLSIIEKIAICQHKAPVKILKPFITLTAITAAATLGTLPLMLIHFNRLSLVTLAANLLIEPIICLFSLPIGFLSVPFMFLIPELSTVLLNIGAFGIELSIQIAKILSGPEFTQLWMPAPSLTLCFLYYLALGLMTGLEISRLRFILGTSGIVVATAGFLLPLSGFSLFPRSTTLVSFLDVGHGSANVIEMKSGRVVIVDGGAKSSPGYDCGERVIAPYLWFHRIGKIDDIIITHDDADHYSGIPSLIKRFNPDRLWIPAIASHKSGFEYLLKTAQESDVEIVTPEAGIIINEGNDTITVITAHINVSDNGSAEFESVSHGDDNGLVVKLRSMQTTILFPGDITKRGEQKLVESGEDLKSTILLSPHHGSSSSNSYDFLSTVAPEYIIFSSGKDKRNLFPARETLATINRLDIATLSTATYGTIMISTQAAVGDKSDYSINTYNISQQTFWKKS